MGGYCIKNEGQTLLLDWPPDYRKEGYEDLPAAGRECLSCLFFFIIDKLFKGLAFLGQFTFSAAYFHMNFWASLPFITDKVTHL